MTIASADPVLPFEREDFVRLYDLDMSSETEDIDMYRRLAVECGGPVLEIGVGTGRVAAPIAADGIDVAGIDCCEAALAIAQEKREKLDDPGRLALHNLDMRDFDLGRKFNLIIFAFNTLNHVLHTPELVAALRCARRHLAPGGRVVADVFSPHTVILQTAFARVLHRSPRLLDDGRTLMCVEQHHLDYTRWVLKKDFVYELIRDGQIELKLAATVHLRMISRPEMELIFSLAQLKVRQIYGSYAQTPLKDYSHQLVYEAVQ